MTTSRSPESKEESNPEKFRRITSELQQILLALKGESLHLVDNKFLNKKTSELEDRVTDWIDEASAVINAIQNKEERARAEEALTKVYLPVITYIAFDPIRNKREKDLCYGAFEPLFPKVYVKIRDFKDLVLLEAEAPQNQPNRLFKSASPSPSSAALKLIQEFTIGETQLKLLLADRDHFYKPMTLFHRSKDPYAFIVNLAAEAIALEANAAASRQSNSKRV